MTYTADMNREHTGVVGIFWYTLISSILLAAVILSLDDISVNDFRDVVLVTIIVQVLQVAL